jgi:2-polyprenyl-3-methyl-5-hydroxy-6-metoxy-1,4-benzoquinol methylase
MNIKKIFCKFRTKIGTDSNLKKFIQINPMISKYSSQNSVYWKDTHQFLDFNFPFSTTSMLCNQSFFDMPFFQFWSARLVKVFHHLMKSTNQLTEKGLSEHIVYHRKLWEFVYIAQALFERNLLETGIRGIGFGVGEEPLAALFADFGCKILATDMNEEKAKKLGWNITGQHASNNLLKLNDFNICPQDKFLENVSYRTVDMNNIPEDLKNFDFCWSACALEHLGSIENGVRFIKNSLKTIKAKGIAIHTTEFNVYSDNETLDNNPMYVLFRKKDINKLISELESEGHYVSPMDFNAGQGILDNFIDLPPFSKKDMHLKLLLDNFVSTSIGLIIKKKG